ncbi:MAG: glycosyltransferase [Muribaculaceae bacterium]|nr:glycosyltransferase [Muribaculaceae bacterium]
MKVLHVFTIINTPRSFFDGQFKYLSDHGQEIHIATDSPEDIDFTKRNNIKYHRIAISRSISPFTDLKTIGALSRLIKKEKFDVVVGHTPKGAMVAMIAAKLTGVKTRIYYRHGYIYTTAKGMKRRLLKVIERITANWSSKVVNVSPSIGEIAIVDKLNPAKKQLVIGAGTCCGIDTVNSFNPVLVPEAEKKALKESLGIVENDFVVGFCGRLCKDKGIPELIDGFKAYNLSNPSAKLLLVGPYDSRDILAEKYRTEINENPNIVATGKVDKEKLPLYYSIMNLFVLPSHREGFGMCVLEASAMEVPILVSRAHGCVDSIVEGKTGKYIDISPKDIVRGLESYKLIANYGTAGRKWVKENFERTNMWPKLLEFYNSLTEV